jgi:hypothetical protein
MKDLLNIPPQEKNLFKTSYCQACQQKKTCGKLSPEYCCQCCYKNQQERWTDYLTHTKALAYEKQQKKEHERNLYQLAEEKTIENRVDFAD